MKHADLEPASERVSEEPDDPPSRYRVDAAAKALALLGAFSYHDRRLSLAELSSRTGVPRATAFRLLATLEEAGYLAKNGSDYQLGFKCFLLSNIAAADLDLRSIARPHLIALRDATGETTQLAILVDWNIVYLDRVLSQQAVGYMTSRAGAVLPSYCTGLGKALLAFQPSDSVEAWARRESFAAFTPTTLTSAESLLAELSHTRERGYAIDRQEREVGVRCVAAPVRDAEGNVVAALSAAGPTERLPAELVGSRLAETVVRAADDVSRDLGYVAPPQLPTGR